MKARIKATGEIVEVIFNSPYYDTTDGKERYYHHELDFQDTLDYWTRLEHQYAGLFIKSFLDQYDGSVGTEDIINSAIKVAHALVEKYKKEEK